MKKTEENGYDPEKDEKGFDSFYDEFHFLLGKIIVKINLVEFKILTMICNLIDPDNILIGFAICKRRGASQLMDLLYDLILTKVKDKEVLDAFSELIIDLKKINEHRNTFIHSVYLDTTDMDMNLSRKIDKMTRIGMREFSKGKKSIDSDLVYELTPLRALVQWLDYTNIETERFLILLSKELTIKSIQISVPEEPEFLKKK